MTNPQAATSPKAWRKRTGGIELTLPSGNVCKVKRPGMEKMLQAGILPDSLTPIAMEHLRQAESGGRPKQDESSIDREIMEKVLTDPSEMVEIFRSFDYAVAMCVTEPKVELHFKQRFNEDGSQVLDEKGRKVFDDIPEDERGDEDDENRPLYTDEVDPDDKQFIFQFVVGGTSDLETFRREQAASLAGS